MPTRRTDLAPTHSRRALLARVAALLLMPAGVRPSQAATPTSVTPPPALRFGILPIAGAVESRESWTPLLSGMSQSIRRPVTARSVLSYEAVESAIQRGEIDLALLSGKLALDAVLRRQMTVVAQVMRDPAAEGHRAVLLARKAGPFNTLAGLLAEPERWRIARGDSRSLTGYILPQLQLFLPNGIQIETRFRSEIVDNHQVTALAVANGDADVATNNSTDYARFKTHFPAEAERLQVIWQSEPTPPLQFLMRRGQPAELQARVQQFLIHYGRASGARGEEERAVLKGLRAMYGYVLADDSALMAVAQVQYRLEKQQALHAQWVSEAARHARLARIEEAHARAVALLRGERR